jgi:hypothetical protein
LKDRPINKAGSQHSRHIFQIKAAQARPLPSKFAPRGIPADYADYSAAVI